MRTRTTRVAVIGAGYAGSVFANRLLDRAADRVAVTVVNPSDRFTDRIRLHEQAASGRDATGMALRDLLDERAEVVVGRVTSLDRDRQVISVVDVTDSVTEIEYDIAVLATGAHSTPIDGALPVDTPAGSTSINRRFRALPSGSRVVVAGNGLTGIELITEMRYLRHDLHYTVAGPSAPLTRAVGTPAGWFLARHLARNEIDDVRAKVTPESNTESENLDADLTVWAGPWIADAAPLLPGAVDVDHGGRILVDENQRVPGEENVYAVGDCARHAATRRMTCQTAMPSGAAAADHIAHRIGATDVTYRFGLKYRAVCISLGRATGLVQPLFRDRVTPVYLNGSLAATVKEQFTAGPIEWIRRQATGVDYTWARSS